MELAYLLVRTRSQQQLSRTHEIYYRVPARIFSRFLHLKNIGHKVFSSNVTTVSSKLLAIFTADKIPKTSTVLKLEAASELKALFIATQLNSTQLDVELS